MTSDLSIMTAEHAIHRFRRDLTLASLLRGVLVGMAAVCLLAGPALGPRFDNVLILTVLGAVWLILTFTSAKGSRLAAISPSLIATGQFDAAERQIDQALRSFSLFRTVKLLSLHHLAVLRHAQRRWQETALLCRALLGQRLGAMQGLSKPASLILADALLEMGDVRGAYDAIAGLYRQRLTLAEVLNLQLVQLDYQSRIGAWAEMLTSVMSQVQLAELMPSASAARSQALLALAAKKVGRNDWLLWLRRRVDLLADSQKLITERPMLEELWVDV